MMGTAPQLGRIGLWSMELRFGDAGAIADAASELDDLGYGTIWVPGGIGGDITGDVSRLLAATRRAAIATGIINIWKHEPAELGDWWASLPAADKARTLLGLGVSHGPLIGETWGKPLAVTRDYVEKLSALGIPAENMCLAALGPKMIALSRDKTAGAHPYLATPEHTAIARELLGPGKLLAPEQGVVLETDPAKARELARGALKFYLTLPNYANNWLRLGFTQDDIDSCSDRLVDGLFAWGDAAAIKTRVDAHLAAGADHVCLQVITGAGLPEAMTVWRELAPALL